MLAELLPGTRWTPQGVGQWENHNRVPAPSVVRALDAIVGADVQLARFAPPAPSTPTLADRVDELEERVRVLEAVIRRLGQ